MTARKGAPAPRREPTEEQYRLAWRHFRGRFGCPDTLEAAKAHRIYGIGLRCLALDMGRAPPFDCKRAAANDRD